MSVERMKSTVVDMSSGMWEKLDPHWQRIKQWSPVQRKMFVAIVLLLVVNIVLVTKISAPQPEVGPLT